MKLELYIKTIVIGVAATIPAAIKVTTLNKSLIKYQSSSETKREIIKSLQETYKDCAVFLY